MGNQSSSILNTGNFLVTKDRPSAHYEWKIESFRSCFNHHPLESGSFEAGGYLWSLVLSLNGRNIDRNNIDVSLKIFDVFNLLRNGSGVSVGFKFFVFDQGEKNKKKHLTFSQSDAEGSETLFNENNTTRSFYHIPPELFQNYSKRYLVSDCCTIGAEISIVPTLRKLESFSIIQHQNRTHEWPFTNFRTLRHVQSSDMFAVGDKNWKILLYPRGHEGMEIQHLSVYLMLCDDQNIYEKFYASFDLRIGNNQNKRQERVGGWSSPDLEPRNAVGSREFIPLDLLHRPENRLIINDTLIVKVVIQEVSVVKRLQI